MDNLEIAYFTNSKRDAIIILQRAKHKKQMKGAFAMKKNIATLLAVLLTLVIIATVVCILCGVAHPVVAVLGMLIGYMMLVDMSLIFGVMGGSYED